jgi:hypothetical protein
MAAPGALPLPGASLPPWFRALERAVGANKGDRASTWLTLATVRQSGRPAARTVVFRGFLTAADFGGAWSPPGGALLAFCTDARSDKVAQLGAGGEAAWYFGVTREQWRLGGSLALVAAAPAEGRAGAAEGGDGGGERGAAEDGLGAARVAITGGPGLAAVAGAPPGALATARERAWEALSDAARGSFAWPPPGAPRAPGTPDAAFLGALPLPASRRRRAGRAAGPQQAEDERGAAAREGGGAGAPQGEAAGAGAGAGAGVAAAAGASPSAAEDAAAEAADAAAFANFALLLLAPEDVDHLQLRPSPTTQRRTRWARGAGGEGAWGMGEEVHP